MVNFDEIDFLESEIVDDDDNAPVGTLIHITDDGKVEEIKPETQSALSYNSLESTDKTAGSTDDIQEKSDELPSDADKTESADALDVTTTDLQDDQHDQVEDASEQIVDEDVVTPIDETPVEELKAEPENENLPVVETPQDIEISDSEENDSLENTAEPTVDENAQDAQPVQSVEEPVAEVVQDAVEQNEQAPVADQNMQEEATETAEPVIDTTPKPVKKRKPAQKKVAEPAPVVNDEAHKTALNLKSGKSVNDELFDTNFEVEKPAKTKVVSTKKKQEKAEDLWAVATVVKPKKEIATAEEKTEVKSANKSSKSAPKAQKQSDDAQVATKKTASKKSTKVENTKTPTEEKKVAKATDKTTKPVQEEKPVKATKTAKAQKETPVKETAVKESPVKEDKAPKATKTVEKDEETVLLEGEGKVHGKYVIKKTDKGNFVFKLFSSNYRVVAIGAQAYTTLGAAKIGVQSIINNAEKAPVENQTLKNYETLKFPKWEIYLDKKGEYRLRLYATNGSLIATTNDGYADISGAKNGIAAVARASKGCAIVRNDNLW
jgi:protein yegP